MSHVVKSIECFKKGCDIIISLTLGSVWKWIDSEKSRAGEMKLKKVDKTEPNRDGKKEP